MARTIPMIQPVSQLPLLALVSPVREGGEGREREGGGGREREREGRGGERKKKRRWKDKYFRNDEFRPHTFLFTFSILNFIACFTLGTD